MNRRKALKQASLILGYSIATPAVVTFLQGCKVEPTLDWNPSFFTIDGLSNIISLMDNIIPESDTPSASEVGVPEFIDLVISEIVGKEEKDLAIIGMKILQEGVAGKKYSDLPLSEQIAMLEGFERAMENDKKENKLSSNWYAAMKGLIVRGYVLSEKVGTEVLAYDPIPGYYNGCIPLKQNGGLNWTL